MESIDREALEHSIAKAFAEVTKAVDRHSERSIEVYSLALQALVALRAQVMTADRHS